MLEKLNCLYALIALYGGLIVALFVRALVRRRLLRDYADLKGEDLAAGIGKSIVRLLLIVPRQIRVLRELGKSIAEAPSVVRRRYNEFRLLSWIALLLVALLVVFSFVAHDICGS